MPSFGKERGEGEKGEGGNKNFVYLNVSLHLKLIYENLNPTRVDCLSICFQIIYGSI
jgi:hypothetical protein